jgi:hypothetical protein
MVESARQRRLERGMRPHGPPPQRH